MPVFVLRVQWIRVDRTPGNGKQMALTRYTLDSVRSCVWVSGRSSLHPINTETRGINGWFEAATRTDGSLDLDQPVSGELELAVERLTSGNQLYDRELRRRIDARRFPTISGRLTRIVVDGAHPEYSVTGEVSFHGKTKTFEHGMRIEASDGGIALTGEDQFDIREFGMKPPSMLMVRVYPEISVRVELQGVPEA
jgi:polyisoprenoid-binding protein YceI